MNFRELNNLLIDARAGSRAAECHGFLCGYFCVNRELQEDTFNKFLLADTADQDLYTECFVKISELAAEVNAKIAVGDYGLQLMLPDDNSSMGEREAALIQWCEGFLSGLGIAGMTGLEALSTEGREVIEDMYKICLLEVEEGDDEGEDEEAAFVELTEYVRMGAILLYEEFHGMITTNDRPGVLH